MDDPFLRRRIDHTEVCTDMDSLIVNTTVARTASVISRPDILGNGTGQGCHPG
ncbi:hypothetical protein [Burkholderia lata]|uniref:hypothetical protein n=1 Tax=Burkholderia lata (strain ATCC 17760 / DSM 23089 / LMG 22485 / NCIMB 9086 / R18194 / 383) TaxID=482957 RepID=UPI00158319F1|nr:hypothetical protein [Burkholderia lata]